MAYVKNKQTTHTKRSYTIPLLVVLVLIIGAAAGFFVMKRNDSRTSSSNGSDVKVPDQEKIKTAQPDFTDGGDRDVVSDPDKKGNGEVTDNQGVIDAVPDQSQWSRSSTGAIAVYTPAKNEKLVSGQKISGESSAGNVTFRLIDNVSGVIASGEIAVVDGKFSGTLNFTTSATEGRLDILTFTEDGREANNVEIPIRF